MRRFKYLFLFAVFFNLIFLTACTENKDSVQTSITQPPFGEEVLIADSLGFKIWSADKVSYSEYYSLLDHVVEITQPERLQEWKKLNIDARSAKNIVSRSSSMVALFNLAEFLGDKYYCYNDPENIIWDNCPWETSEWNPDPYWGDLLRFAKGFNGKLEEDGSNYGGDAYFYSMGRVSLRSGKSVFDGAGTSMRCKEALTSEEAICSVLRLYESALSPSKRIPDETDRFVISEADRRKQEILNAKTEIVSTGNCYYVSVNGDDHFSGNSPESPWRTLEKVSNASLQSGDTVFFKRGDIWRGESLCIKPGVTYSAYGDGAKPAFYGSPENGASPEKWSLLDGTDNIWVYDKDILECGYIVIDGGLSAFKIAPYLEHGEYTMPDGSGRSFDIREALTQDLMFYSEDDSFVRNIDVYTEYKRPGKLYLRCDKGNPGSVFSSIEFCPWMNEDTSHRGIIYAKNDTFLHRDMITIDNLTVKYTGVYGINLAGSTVTVQNCEVGWIGGCITNYVEPYNMIRFGNCVGSFGDIDGYRVLNCYLYQALDSGISDEGMVPESNTSHHKNIEYSNNVIENCVFGIEMFIGNDDPSVEIEMEEIKISNNLIMDTGFGFGSNRQYRTWDSHAAIMMHPNCTNIRNMMVENNVFYRSKTFLLCNLIKSNCEEAQFSGNTYVQDNIGILCLWLIEDQNREFLFNHQAEDTVKTVVKDNTATVAKLSF